MATNPASSLKPGQKILALVDESHLLAAARAMNKSIDWLAVREYLLDEGEHLLNPGRRTLTLVVRNTADRPIQVGSHYHFAETNGALDFDRAAAQGMRLNIASGTAVRFEPGQQRTVELVDYAGERIAIGFRGLTDGPIDR